MRILTRTITPTKAPFDYNKFEREFRTEFNQFIRADILDDFKKTIVGWRNKPSFDSRVRISQRRISFSVNATGPHADQYDLVDAGSPGHIITPRVKPRLVYRRGYFPSTSPRTIASRRSTRAGRLVTAQIVDHPGFEGREFYSTIGKEYIPEYRRRIKNALQRATRALAREQGL